MEQHSQLTAVAGAVRAEIARDGRTAAEIAEIAAIPSGTMYRKLRAEYWFTLPELFAIADAVGVDVTTFLPTPPPESPSSRRLASWAGGKFIVNPATAFHPSVILVGMAAMGLWLRAGAWAAQHQADGFVPRAIQLSLELDPYQRGSAEHSANAQTLVDAGLWDAVEDGYRFAENSGVAR